MIIQVSAVYPPFSVPITVDVTAGDRITPKETEYTFSLLFDDRSIDILFDNAYRV